MIINATKKAKSMHARRNPNLSVTATAYAQLSPSVTSASFLSPTAASRRSLLSPSGPLSPSLPSLIPRHGKKQPSSGKSRSIQRVLAGIICSLIALYLIIHHLFTPRPQPTGDVDSDYEMVGAGALPDVPTAVVVQDARGNARWTVSIPPKADFPLRPDQYQEICHQSMELSKQLQQEARMGPIMKRMLSYYAKDQSYLDVQEAVEQGLLPASQHEGRPHGFVDDVDIAAAKNAPINGLAVCDRSLTYVMETQDAGFGSTLLRMWMSYGLAMKEKRAFFVDDTRWPYGRFSTYFTPPPSPGCLPPPTSHMVPCPHSARHIVVSGATVRQTFGHAFTEEFEDARKMRVQRQHRIFGLLRTGYEALFKLRSDDASYVTNRAETLYAPVAQDGGINVGMHVRHGDKHPYEYQYQKDYIPLDRYIDTAREQSKKKAALIVASDDPSVYESPEFTTFNPPANRAQDRIVLATKRALEAAQGKKNPWIDEVTGWEGGFYRDIFFSLGQPVGNANDVDSLDNNEKLPESALRLRELVGRAYLMDLAVLAQADRVVCTVSSIGCRILAVMFGWDRAIIKGEWVNVDGQFEWKGIVW
ncbi:hypothetical protein M011DRAFT_475228 [Sporormia fimetaria CBS 119925]|uniref:Uncharacterized protein n=1 Tax=Sporormia fimetaria CBS 119925 TaxID=1340428 RepID=A0A6A6VL17_9PLEO|nr:hypothetical protein M011DRAFT_475228 [Sporormia fimetaria CBS 119925]